MTKEKLGDILDGAPDNWGRWGDDDEVGAINFLDNDEILDGVRAVEDGESFTLGLPVFGDQGSFKVPTRADSQHHMTVDKGHYEAGKAGGEPSSDDHTESALRAYRRMAGLETADDSVYMFLHGPTHIDALGHAWYDDTLYNGVDAGTTKGGLEHGSIEPVADHGIVGRAVLVDIARHRGVDHLEPGELITLDELRECIDDQDVTLSERDIVLIRTGWIERFYELGPDGVDLYDEPGITATEELLEWFHEMEIPLLGTDTLRNEQTVSEETDTFLPLHAAFLRDMGIPMNEILKLNGLAEYCAQRDKYDMLYVGSPLKLVGATGSPVNPIAIL